MPPSKVTSALIAQDQAVEDLTGQFRKGLDDAFKQVLLRVSGELQRSIDFVGDGPEDRVKNRRELRRIARLIDKYSNAAGVPDMLNEFTSGFESTLPLFDDVLSAISASIKTPLVVKRTAQDLLALEGVKDATKMSLDSAIEVMISQAKRNLLFQVGALDFEATVERIQRTFDKGIAEAQTLAATGLTMYTRTNADQNFKRIEQSFPDAAILYKYDGPKDKLTRPFCAALLKRTAKAGLTREQIDKLDNGQIQDVFLSCGGFNCRHQWVLTLKGEKAAKKAKKAAEEKKPPEVFPSVEIEQSEVAKKAILDGIPEYKSQTQAIKNKKAVAANLAARLRENAAFKKLAAEIGTGKFSRDPLTDACAVIVQTWAATSSNERPLSLAVQLAAEKQFGLNEWSTFRTRSAWPEATALYEKHKEGLSAFLSAQYELTQEYFAKKGISDLFLFRGMRHSKGLDQLLASTRESLIGTHSIDLQPLSSFSADIEVSKGFTNSFAGTLLLGSIPVERIFSICRTGFGCLNEVEAVILSGKGSFWEYAWRTQQAAPSYAMLKEVLKKK